MENKFENKFEENFEEIYKDVYETANESLEKAKKTKNKHVIIVFSICLIIMILTKIISKENRHFYLTIVIFVISIVAVLIIENKRYANLFKKNVIENLVKKCNSKLNFNQNGTMSRVEYKKSGFDKEFNKFYSEDKIYGKISKNIDFQMAQIVTKEEKIYIDEHGNREVETTETFRGMFGIVSLDKSTEVNAYIAPNALIKKYSNDRIEMDSSEFEQWYDCLTEDKIKTMKIFTADLLELFVKLKKGKLKNFQFKIADEKIYFRCACGEMFEPPKIKNALDKEIIKKYYNMIFYPIKIVEKTIENINNML